MPENPTNELDQEINAFRPSRIAIERLREDHIRREVQRRLEQAQIAQREVEENQRRFEEERQRYIREQGINTSSSLSPIPIDPVPPSQPSRPSSFFIDRVASVYDLPQVAPEGTQIQVGSSYYIFLRNRWEPNMPAPQSLDNGNIFYSNSPLSFTFDEEIIKKVKKKDVKCPNCLKTFTKDFFRPLTPGFDEQFRKKTCLWCRNKLQNKFFMGSFLNVPNDNYDLTYGLGYKFGVEIECIKPTIKIGSFAHSLDHRRADSLKKLDFIGFHLGTDASIGDFGEEHRSVILHGTPGIAAVRRHAAQLNKRRYSVDKRCGLHVHIDGRDIGYMERSNIISFMQLFDRLFFRFVDKSRWENRYCIRFPVTRSGVVSVHTKLQAAEKSALNLSDLFIRCYQNVPRYSGFNFTALWKHTTFEFRYHHGTINAEEIENWIVLCMHTIHAARKEFVSDEVYERITKMKALDRLMTFFALIDAPTHIRKFYLRKWKANATGKLTTITA